MRLCLCTPWNSCARWLVARYQSLECAELTHVFDIGNAGILKSMSLCAVPRLCFHGSGCATCSCDTVIVNHCEPVDISPCCLVRHRCHTPARVAVLPCVAMPLFVSESLCCPRTAACATVRVNVLPQSQLRPCSSVTVLPRATVSPGPFVLLRMCCLEPRRCVSLAAHCRVPVCLCRRAVSHGATVCVSIDHVVLSSCHRRDVVPHLTVIVPGVLPIVVLLLCPLLFPLSCRWRAVVKPIAVPSWCPMSSCPSLCHCRCPQPCPRSFMPPCPCSHNIAVSNVRSLIASSYYSCTASHFLA